MGEKKEQEKKEQEKKEQEKKEQEKKEQGCWEHGCWEHECWDKVRKGAVAGGVGGFLLGLSIGVMIGVEVHEFEKHDISSWPKNVKVDKVEVALFYNGEVGIYNSLSVYNSTTHNLIDTVNLRRTIHLDDTMTAIDVKSNGTLCFHVESLKHCSLKSGLDVSTSVSEVVGNLEIVGAGSLGYHHVLHRVFEASLRTYEATSHKETSHEETSHEETSHEETSHEETSHASEATSHAQNPLGV